MTEDPVCGMNINEHKAKSAATYGGRAYYFCSPSCKSMFDKDPQKYAARAQQESQEKQSYLFTVLT